MVLLVLGAGKEEVIRLWVVVVGWGRRVVVLRMGRGIGGG